MISQTDDLFKVEALKRIALWLGGLGSRLDV